LEPLENGSGRGEIRDGQGRQGATPNGARRVLPQEEKQGKLSGKYPRDSSFRNKKIIIAQQASPRMGTGQPVGADRASAAHPEASVSLSVDKSTHGDPDQIVLRPKRLGANIELQQIKKPRNVGQGGDARPSRPGQAPPNLKRFLNEGVQ